MMTMNEPVVVTMVGAQTGTGDGRFPIQTGTIGQTPRNQPDVIFNVVAPVIAILVRFTNAYLITFSGLVTAGMASDLLPASDFLHLVIKCAQLSVAGAGIGAIKDITTVFGKLEGKYPLLSGSV